MRRLSKAKAALCALVGLFGGISWGSEVKSALMDDPFSSVTDPQRRADLYQKVAGEYSELAKTASSPFLRGYYERLAEAYRLQAVGELKVLGVPVVERGEA